MTITTQVPRVSDLDDRDRDCIRALYDASCAHDLRRSRHGLPVEGTCRWVFDDDTFTAWEDGTSGLLWVTANAAGGKSVFANGYVEQVAKSRPNVVVGSFFFDTNAANEALSAVLHQILTKYPAATRHAREEFAAKGHSFTHNTRTLWSIICDISRDFFSDAIEVLLVLDGLDECGEPSKSVLIQELASTFSGDAQKDVPGRLKVLMTSRPNTEIARVLRPIRRNTYFGLGNATIPLFNGTPDVANLPVRRIAHLKGEENTMPLLQDVRDVVDFRVNELRSKTMLADTNAHFLRNVLLLSVDDSFLWVSTVLKHFLESGSMARSAIEAAIQGANRELYGLYAQELDSTSDAGRELLQCMVAAESPLSLGEVNAALALRDSVGSVAALGRELEPDIEHTVKILGGFFVRITGGRLHFVHSTAREFLGERPPTDRVPLDVDSCHLAMAERCLRILTALFEPSQEYSFTSPLEKPRFAEFYRYAAANWHVHTEAAGAHWMFDPACNSSSRVLKLWESIRVLCDPERGFFGVWWPTFAARNTKLTFTRKDSVWYSTPPSEGTPGIREYPLHRAISEDSLAVLHALLHSAPHLSITDKNDDGKDALDVAIAHQSWNVTPWILTNFPDAPLHREAALGTALRSSNDNTVAQLLCPAYWNDYNVRLCGAKPPFSTDRMDAESVALLTANINYACVWGRSKMVAELIENGADVNKKSGGVSPLLAAVLSGDAAIVDSLLEHDASPDAPCSPIIDPSDITLSDLGAQPGAVSSDFLCTFWQFLWRYLGPSCHGITPLGLAAQLNHAWISKSLRLRGKTDETTALALRRAFPRHTPESAPSPELRKITLQHLHLLKEPEALARSICHEAMTHGSVAVTDELIRYGCLQLPPDSSGKTVLHIAAEGGNVESVTALSRAASPGTLFARDDLGRTCLRLALQTGHGEAAKRILEVDPSLASQARGCRRMLHDAVYGGVKTGVDVVNDVLALGDEVDAKDAEGRTALHHTVLATKVWDPTSGTCGAVDVVKALVIAGAEYNLANDQNQTPLALTSTILGEGAGLPAQVRAALEELEATLVRVPLWGDNRLDGGAIRGNYEQFLSEGRAQKGDGDVEFGDNWMFESEDCDDEEDEED